MSKHTTEVNTLNNGVMRGDGNVKRRVEQLNNEAKNGVDTRRIPLPNNKIDHDHKKNEINHSGDNAVRQNVKTLAEESSNANTHASIGLEKGICEAETRAEAMRGENVVFFLGMMGAGKSTTIAFLMGAIMEKIRIEGMKRVIVNQNQSQDRYPMIGHTYHSQTLLTEKFRAVDGTSLGDCAGLEGNGSEEKTIIESISTELAMKTANSIRVAIVINKAELQAARGSSFFKKLCKQLGELFKNPDQITHSVLWLITGGDEDDTVDDFLQTIRGNNGAMSFLSSIYNRISKTIQEAGSGAPLSALQTLLGTQTDVQDLLDIERQKAILESMTHDNVMLVNNFSAQTRTAILNRLNRLDTISIDQFCFDKYGKVRVKFRKRVEDIVNEGITTCHDLKKLNEEKAEAERTLSETEKKIKDSEETNGNIQGKTIEDIRNVWISSNKAESEFNIKRKQEINRKMKELTQELNKLDLEEEVLLWKDKVYEERRGLLERLIGSTVHEFLYSGQEHYSRCKEMYDRNTGSMRSRREAPQDGIYSSTYQSNYGETGDATVELYIKKKDLRANAMRITQIRKELRDLELEKHNLDEQAIQLIRQLKIFQEENFNSRHVQIERERLNTEKVTLVELIQKKNKGIIEVKNRIRQRLPIFRAIHQIVLKMPSTFESDLIKKFEEVWIYTQKILLDKESNDHPKVSKESVERLLPSKVASEALLRGKLDAETLYFSKTPNGGLDANQRPGSCGFISLETTRESVLKTLTADSNLNNVELRELIGRQIDNDFPSVQNGLHLNKMHIERLQNLSKDYSEAQETRNAVIEKLKAGAGLKNANEEELIKHYTATQNSDSILRLQKVKAELDRTQKALQDFSTSRSVIEDYLNHNIMEGWLGAHVALAWAKATNRTLRIWKHLNEESGSGEIVLLPGLINIAAGDIAPIDIIHTAGGTHYERLVQQPAPNAVVTASAASTSPSRTFLLMAPRSSVDAGTTGGVAASASSRTFRETLRH